MSFLLVVELNQDVLAADGDLLISGSNDNGQLGEKTAEMKTEAARVAALDAFSVHHTATGLLHAAAVIGDGMLASWGSNEYGQLGEAE